MSGELSDYVRYRIERSNEAFRVGERALTEDDLHEAVGRLYYACFHLVSALLLLEGYTSKKHRGTWTLFDVHWIKTDRLSKSFGRYYHLLYGHRQDADYADQITFERRDVERWYEDGKKFRDALSSEIDKLLEEGNP